jgi:hypothetical protein
MPDQCKYGVPINNTRVMKSDESRPESYLPEVFFNSDLPDTSKTDSHSKPRTGSTPITPMLEKNNDLDGMPKRSIKIDKPIPMK